MNRVLDEQRNGIEERDRLVRQLRAEGVCILIHNCGCDVQQVLYSDWLKGEPIRTPESRWLIGMHN